MKYRLYRVIIGNILAYVLITLIHRLTPSFFSKKIYQQLAYVETC